MKKVSIRTKILLPTIAILIIANLITSIVTIYKNYNNAKVNLIEKAYIAIKPILLNSNVAVSGANMMKLKSKDAKSLYMASDALYIVIKGKSNKIPKTIFAPEQPPKQLEYKYSYHCAFMPKVKIFEELGNYYLQVEGMNDKVKVEKI